MSNNPVKYEVLDVSGKFCTIKALLIRLTLALCWMKDASLVLAASTQLLNN